MKKTLVLLLFSAVTICSDHVSAQVLNISGKRQYFPEPVILVNGVAGNANTWGIVPEVEKYYSEYPLFQTNRVVLKDATAIADPEYGSVKRSEMERMEFPTALLPFCYGRPCSGYEKMS